MMRGIILKTGRLCIPTLIVSFLLVGVAAACPALPPPGSTHIIQVPTGTDGIPDTTHIRPVDIRPGNNGEENCVDCRGKDNRNSKRWELYQQMQEGRQEYADTKNEWSDYCGKWEDGATVVKWTCIAATFYYSWGKTIVVKVVGAVGRGVITVTQYAVGKMNSSGSGSDPSVGGGSSPGGGSVSNQASAR
jgi:hypothetical protein